MGFVFSKIGPSASALAISYLMTAFVVPVLARHLIDFNRWRDPGAEDETERQGDDVSGTSRKIAARDGDPRSGRPYTHCRR